MFVANQHFLLFFVELIHNLKKIFHNFLEKETPQQPFNICLNDENGS
jgi:hypothetical protein